MRLDIMFDMHQHFRYDLWIRTRFNVGYAWIRILLDTFGYALTRFMLYNAVNADGFKLVTSTQKLQKRVIFGYAVVLCERC